MFYSYLDDSIGSTGLANIQQMSPGSKVVIFDAGSYANVLTNSPQMHTKAHKNNNNAKKYCQ